MFTKWILFQHFLIYKCMGVQIWPCRKRSKVNLRPSDGPWWHYLTKVGRTWVPYAIYQDSASKLSWFWRIKFLNVCYHIWARRPFCSVARVQTNCQYPFDRRPRVKSNKYVHAVSEKKTFKNYTNLYMYAVQGTRADNPYGTKSWL